MSREERDTVLFVSALPYLGGAQVSLATTLRHLPRGIRAAVAVPSRGPFVERVRAERPDHEILAIPQIGTGNSVTTRLAIALVLARWLLRNRRRVLALHANGDSELKLVLPVLPLARGRVVVWAHRAELSSTTTRFAPLWRMLRRNLVWAAVSGARRDELLDARVGDARNVSVVPNPIDPDDVVAGAPVAHEGYVVGYLGCEYESKGFTLLPAIAHRLRGTTARILCVVKGVDEAANSVAVNDAFSELRRLPQEVEFAHRAFDVSLLYAQFDAVLVPSRSESFSRVTAEAMLNGLPVVACDLPAVRELLEDGAGVVFPPDDAEAAARAILALEDDPRRGRQLGAEGRRRAQAFTPQRVVAQLERLYRS